MLLAPVSNGEAMLRKRILVIAIPVIAIAAWSQVAAIEASAPCVASATGTVRPASALSWSSDYRIAFTEDASAAAIRVKFVDDAVSADFLLADDTAEAEASACGPAETARSVKIVETPEPGDTVIFLTESEDADLRVYADSRRIPPRLAAAMFVAASRDRVRLAAAPSRPR